MEHSGERLLIAGGWYFVVFSLLLKNFSRKRYVVEGRTAATSARSVPEMTERPRLDGNCVLVHLARGTADGES